MDEAGWDLIRIRDLQLPCLIGVFEHERHEKQTVCIDITLAADLAKAGASDDLRDTIDYKELRNRVMALVEGSAFNLVERLAEEIARLCLDTPGVRQVRVAVGKPGALRFARTVEVEIVRRRAAVTVRKDS